MPLTRKPWRCRFWFHAFDFYDIHERLPYGRLGKIIDLKGVCRLCGKVAYLYG